MGGSVNRFSDWQMTLVKYIRAKIAKYFVKFYDDFATFVELFEKQCDQMWRFFYNGFGVFVSAKIPKCFDHFKVCVDCFHLYF